MGAKDLHDLEHGYRHNEMENYCKHCGADIKPPQNFMDLWKAVGTVLATYTSEVYCPDSPNHSHQPEGK
jgi:hypothetical protein